MMPLEVRLDTLVKEKMEAEQIPVFAVGVVSGGEVKVAKTYRAVKYESVFEPCISSEEFTAAAVLVLASQGTIQLDLPPSKYLTRAPLGLSDKSIRHLLSSGSLWSTLAPWYRPDTERASKTTATLVSQAERGGPDPVGDAAKIDPDSEGSCLLQLLIENMTRQDYSDFVKAAIFRPVGMESTEFMEVQSANPGRMEGFVINSKREGNPSLARTTLRDLVLWEQALWQDKLLNTEELRALLESRPTTATQKAVSGFDKTMLGIKRQPIAIPDRNDTPGNVSIYRVADRKLSIVVASSASARTSRDLAEQLASFWLRAKNTKPQQTTPPHNHEIRVISELVENFRGSPKRAGL